MSKKHVTNRLTESDVNGTVIQTSDDADADVTNTIHGSRIRGLVIQAGHIDHIDPTPDREA